MNIIRQYKLHLLNIENLDNNTIKDLNIIFKHIKYCKENEKIIYLIYNLVFNLKKVILYKYPDSLFYFKDKNLIFDFTQNEIWFDNIILLTTSKSFLKSILYIINEYHNLKASKINSINYPDFTKSIEEEYLNYSSEF